MKNCFRNPIPEIQLAADLLEQAAEAHIDGDHQTARARLLEANIPAVRDFTESLWGKSSPYVPLVPKSVRSVASNASTRMPTGEEKRAMHARDGFHCRFCGMPLIRSEVRQYLVKAYPELGLWAAGNKNQHAAFQCMWVQYDHLTPHSRGGTNELANMVVTCAPCNYSRMQFTLEEVGLANPLNREPERSAWDGLERLLPSGKRIVESNFH